MFCDPELFCIAMRDALLIYLEYIVYCFSCAFCSNFSQSLYVSLSLHSPRVCRVNFQLLKNAFLGTSSESARFLYVNSGIIV